MRELLDRLDRWLSTHRPDFVALAPLDAPTAAALPEVPSWVFNDDRDAFTVRAATGDRMGRPGTDREPLSRRWRCDALALTLALAGCSEPAAAPVDASSALDASTTFDVPSPFDAPTPDVPVRDLPARDVVGPLGLRPGVAATLPLGPLMNPSAVDLRRAAVDIDYRVDLAARGYVVRLPARFDPADTARRYGLISYVDFADTHAVPPSYEAALDAHDVIWVAGLGVGNGQPVSLRRGVALLGALRAAELFPVDPARVYAAGLSGGGRVTSDLAQLRTDVFRGFLGRVGASFPARIPGWQTAGASAAEPDRDYETMLTATPGTAVLPASFRTALITQYGDFRRAEIVAIYRYGHLNHGNAVRLVMRPGGHGDELGESFADALDWLEAPGVDVAWDRFEDGSLDANLDPGRAAVGRGIVVRGGAVSESRYAYGGGSMGVLRLDGNAAAAELADTFAWQEGIGATIDARLRAETAAGLNQEIGLHVVPAGSTAAAAGQPGFHVYWGYGRPHRAELVTVDGARRPLAAWTFPGAHPMDLPVTVTSPQSGEGQVPEKTFWNAALAPDAAGAALRFRGEDLRVVLSRVGFQLTFNRPAAALVTAYPNQVVLASEGDGETLPVVLQGFWREVEPAALAALPVGRWRLVVTNDAVDAARPTGSALVDELRVVAPTAAP